jgi:D-serine deaminase-like pyridoxal phosphate-dependent protein
MSKEEYQACAIGTPKKEIDTPALCVDINLLQKNIEAMKRHLEGGTVSLRPHTKTHKSPIIAKMQIDAGAIGICCAKLGEAEVMAEAGIPGILIPNQIVSPQKITRLVNLAAWADVCVAVEDAKNVDDIDRAALSKGVKLKVIIEMDVGMNRCGVRTVESGLALAKDIAGRKGLIFKGIMGYEGHCVTLMPLTKREEVARTSLAKLIEFAKALEQNGIPAEIVSGGGTGTYKTTPDVAGMTEIQAGSYATMDAKYYSVGITEFGRALTILSTVISVPDPDHAVCDVGLKSATSEFGIPEVKSPQGWRLAGLSEEHGKLERDGGSELHPGDVIEIYPSHGCTTINLHDRYFVHRDGILEAVWPIAGRGRFR